MKLLLSLCLFFFSSLSAKVLVMTHCYNSPEFISYQWASLNKFMKDEFSFVVFNDASDPQVVSEIESICTKYQIQCQRVPQQIHTLPYLARDGERTGGASVECCDTIQYMLNSMGFAYPGCVVLLDSDMFLIHDLNVEELLQRHELIGHPQTRQGVHETIEYILPNLILFNMNSLPDKNSFNVNLGTIDGVTLDSGGFIYYYLKLHPTLSWQQCDIRYGVPETHLHLDRDTLKRLRATPLLYQMVTSSEFDYEYYMKYTFFHFRAGSNWYNKERHWFDKKKQLFFDAMDELLKS